MWISTLILLALGLWYIRKYVVTYTFIILPFDYIPFHKIYQFSIFHPLSVKG